MCFLHIACVINIAYLEEAVGEMAIRLGHAFLLVTTGCMFCLDMIFSGDVMTGVCYNMVMRSNVIPGTRTLYMRKSKLSVVTFGRLGPSLWSY